MSNHILTILVGDPEKAKYLIVSKETVIRTTGGEIITPRFLIFSDKQTFPDKISSITIRSKGLTKKEEVLILRELVRAPGNTGITAKKFFHQNVST